MWKKLGIIALSVSIFAGTVSAFSDVKPNTEFGKKIEFLIEKNVLKDGSYLKSSETVPQKMFWETILRLEKTTDISEDDIIKLARRHGISGENLWKPMPKTEALKKLLHLTGEYNLRPNQMTETAFRKKILNSFHRKYFLKNKKLTRKEFFEWVYNFVVFEAKNTNSYKKPTKTEKPEFKEFPPVEELESLQKIYDDIVRLAEKSNELTDQKKWEVRNAAIEAMFNELGDEYGVFFAPKDSKVFEQSIDSKFVGVGIYIKPLENGILVEKFLPDSPAKIAGLKVNDIIVQVDEFKYESADKYVDLANKIRGEINTNVDITVLRNNTKKIITVKRAQIKVPAVEVEIKNGVPVVKISTFSNKVADEFLSVLNENKTLMEKGFVIDLRNNSGGYLTSAAKLSSIFAKQGELMFLTNYDNRPIKYVADLSGPLADLKNIVILQNKTTASSAEIFASFLSRSNRAKLYGTTTRGKGTIQQIKNYPNGASIKVTIGDWRPFDGVSINKKGLEPDVRFAGRTTEQIKQNIDPALNAAVRSIKNN